MRLIELNLFGLARSEDRIVRTYVLCPRSKYKFASWLCQLLGLTRDEKRLDCYFVQIELQYYNKDLLCTVL